MDDTWPRAGDVILIALRLRLHIRYTRRAQHEWRRQVRLDVRLPLIYDIRIIHALAIFPMWIRDSAVVD